MPDVARLRAAAEAFRRRPKISRTQEQVSHELAELRQVCDLIELEFSDLASEFAATDEYDLQGFDSAISWIKEICHMSGGAAADRVCAGHQLQRLSQSEDAVVEGRIGFAHFVLLARTAAALGGRFDETKLLRKATEFSVRRFHNECMHARHAANPEGFVDEEKEGVEARSLTLTTADDGVVLVQGILDKAGGRDGVLTPDFGQGGRKACVRLHGDPYSPRLGLDGDRCRARQASGVGSTEHSAQCSRPWLHLAGL